MMHRLLTADVSLVVEHRLQGTWASAVEHGSVVAALGSRVRSLVVVVQT